VIQKGRESRHLNKPLGRKVANLKNKSTKGGAQNPMKINCPSGLKTRPLFALGWVFSAVFLLAWELTKQLNV